MTSSGRDVFFDFIVDVPNLGDKRFTYRVPDGKCLPYGMKVRVPFGPSTTDAFAVSSAGELPDKNVKDISYAYDARFLPSRPMIEFCADLATYYFTSVASMWSCLWPPIVPRMRQPMDFLDDEPAEVPKSVRGRDGREEAIFGSREGRWDRYTEIIRDELRQGNGSLVLVPETKEMAYAIARLKEVAGSLVTPVSSEMTGLARREGWLLSKTMETPVVVGTRSAVFSDIRRLGAIIVDEDWSDSYKSVETPLYDARTVARLRGHHQGATVFYGSSHPSLWAYDRAREGLMSKTRQPFPPVAVEIVDLKAGGTRKEALSAPLRERMRASFENDERVFLFLNKRGDSSQVTCQDCGNTISCPSCSSPLVYYSKRGTVSCHTCDYSLQAPDVCPACGGSRWRFLGFGIEKAASEIKKHFPDVPLFRLDKDTIANETVKDVISSFSTAGPSCLLGTQLALGQPGFPPVALVGVLSGDTILNLPDFRASERVFHTLWRLRDLASSRTDGKVPQMIAQTYNPEHHAVRGLLDPEEFYEEELSLRRAVGYPPFMALFKVRFSGKNLDRVKASAKTFSEECGKVQSDIRVLGPIPSPKPKVRGQYRWQVALKHKDHAILVRACERALKAHKPTSAVKIIVDTDPVDMW